MMKIVKYLSFLLAIFLPIASGLVPHHRKVRQIRPQDVRTVSEEDMKAMSPEKRAELNKQYTLEFFKPLNKRVPMSVKYFMDKKSFLREPPHDYLIKNQLLPNFTDIDFDQRVRQKKDMYLPLYLHEEEVKTAEGENNTEEFLTVNKDKMLTVLNNVFTVPRNYRSASLRDAASDYITQKFGNLGLLVGLQYFYPSRFYNQFVGYDWKSNSPLQTLPPGANIFGILPGKLWGTSRDRVVIIGAHWDTMTETDGYNDNGSGVAAVLELARQFVESHCKPKNTIIFATFDLEEMGGQGSDEFVKRFLLPDILRKYGQSDIAGTFIVDTLMNLNLTDNSQMLPEQWSTMDKVTADKIKANGMKGDFMSILQRRQPDQKLVATFTKHWNHLQENSEKKYKLRPFRLDLDKKTPDWETLDEYVPFIRSDHSRFWIINETDFTSLPAILLTDTGPLRGRMVECYHQACDSVRGPYTGSFADMDFYEHTVQALLNTMVEMSKSQCLNTNYLNLFYSELEENNQVATSNGSFLGGSLLSLTDFIRRFMPW